MSHSQDSSACLMGAEYTVIFNNSWSIAILGYDLGAFQASFMWPESATMLFTNQGFQIRYYASFYSYENLITYSYLISPMKMRSLWHGKIYP